MLENIIMIVTMIVTWIFGFIAKKNNIKTDLIPYQNLVIGSVVAIIYWIINKDFKESIAISGLLAGGVYDIFHNIKKMSWYQKYIK